MAPHEVLSSAPALIALLAPQAASANGGGYATKLAQRDNLIHGIAGDEEHVFVSEPGIGVGAAGPRVVVLDRDTGARCCPPAQHGRDNALVTASDQEYRWATLNVALKQDMFRPPFTMAEFWPR